MSTTPGHADLARGAVVVSTTFRQIALIQQSESITRMDLLRGEDFLHASPVRARLADRPCRPSRFQAGHLSYNRGRNLA
jgi:hypothetical protein